MERKGNHRLYAREVDDDSAVVVGGLFGVNLFKIALPAVYFKEFARGFIGLPYAGKAGCFRRHDVDAEAEIHGEVLYSGADKFEHLIFYEALFEGRADESYRNVLRAHALFELAAKVHGDNLGALYVVRLPEELFYEFGAALTHRHGAESAVTRV